MDSSQSQEFVAVAVGEEHAERALVPGLLEGRYSDVEGGCERVPKLGDGPVERGVEGRDFGCNTGEGRREFPYSYVDAVETGLGEDIGLDGLRDGLGVLEGHGLGLHTDGHHQGAEGLLRSDVGEAEWHDSSERQPSSLKVNSDVGEDAVPEGRDGMAVDGAQLATEGLGIRATLALGPGRAGLEDEGLVAEQAVGVGVGVGIVFGETGLVDIVLGLVRLRRGWRNEGRAKGEGDSGWVLTPIVATSTLD
jgi:hypothetical protein